MAEDYKIEEKDEGGFHWTRKVYPNGGYTDWVKDVSTKSDTTVKSDLGYEVGTSDKADPEPQSKDYPNVPAWSEARRAWLDRRKKKGTTAAGQAAALKPSPSPSPSTSPSPATKP